MEPKKSTTVESSGGGKRVLVALVVSICLLVEVEGGVMSPRVVVTENDIREPPVTSSDLPKQIPAPPQPPFASTPHYEQQIARFVWETPHYNTPYPVIQT